MTKEELYKALYTDLETIPTEEEKNKRRKNTLKNLLGVDDEGLEGQVKKYNKIQFARKQLGNTDAENTELELYFKSIAQYWKALHHLYVCYLEKLKGKAINKILIYEAPPMPSKKKGKNNGKINYILAESCGDINCGLFSEKPTGAYSTTIKNLNTKDEKIQKILVDQGILFIDLCPLPLPMTTDIRKEKWTKVLDKKPLTVVLLELALRFALENGIKISKKPIIAIGTPTATSQSIYLYFENMKSSGCLTKPFISPNICQEDNYPKINFSKLLETNKKYEEEGQILPLYKSNIIAGSNTPNSELLQRIFCKSS